MLSGRMPPTANTRACPSGSTARHAFSAPATTLRREHLESVGARRQCGERFGRRRDAGKADEPQPFRFADHGDVAVRHHDEAPAGRATRARPRHRSPFRRRRGNGRRMLASSADRSNGRGELSGTSSTRKPFATSAPPIAGISSGVMPRSTAMSGSGRGTGERIRHAGFPQRTMPALPRDAKQAARGGIAGPAPRRCPPARARPRSARRARRRRPA